MGEKKIYKSNNFFCSKLSFYILFSLI